MKKYLLGCSLAALLVAGHAQAADVVQTYEAPEIAPAAVIASAPAFSWDGFYIGGQLGGSWGDTDATVRAHPAGGGSFDVFRMSFDPNGFIGGLYAGYNFDLGNDVIIGLETDFVWGNVDDRTGYMTALDIAGTGFDVVARVGIDQKWAGATRVRAGYAMDRFLPYVSAGVAYTKLQGSVNGWLENPTGSGTRVAGSEFSGSESDTFTGWTLGLGADYAMTDNVLLRAEYRYSDYGSKTYREDLGGGNAASLKIDHKSHDMRFGVAYKF